MIWLAFQEIPGMPAAGGIVGRETSHFQGQDEELAALG